MNARRSPAGCDGGASVIAGIDKSLIAKPALQVKPEIAAVASADCPPTLVQGSGDA